MEGISRDKVVGILTTGYRLNDRAFIFRFPTGVGEFLGAFAKLRKATISFVMCVRTEQLGSH